VAELTNSESCRSLYRDVPVRASASAISVAGVNSRVAAWVAVGAAAS
jgi:hypothetical protein